MSHLYPLVETAVLAACLGLLLFLAAVVSRAYTIWRGVGWSAVGTAWLLLIWEMARAGLFEGTRVGSRTVSAVVILLPLAAGAVALGASGDQTMRRAVKPADLVSLHAFRLVALVALVAWAGEAVPAWLALPIGVGEPLVGLAALRLGRRLSRESGAAGMTRTWTAVGGALALFMVFATTGTARSSGYFFSLYPLVLFPTFLGPAALLLHAATLKLLGPPKPPSPPAPAS